MQIIFVIRIILLMRIRKLSFKSYPVEIKLPINCKGSPRPMPSCRWSGIRILRNGQGGAYIFWRRRKILWRGTRWRVLVGLVIIKRKLKKSFFSTILSTNCSRQNLRILLFTTSASRYKNTRIKTFSSMLSSKVAIWKWSLGLFIKTQENNFILHITRNKFKVQNQHKPH